MTNAVVNPGRGKLLKIMTTLGILCLSIAASAAAPQEATPQNLNIQLPPLPKSPIEKAEEAGTALRISLQDVTKLALQNNLDIAISDTNEELNRQRIIQAYGPYEPTLSATIGLQRNKRPNTNLATATTQGSFSQTDNAYWNFTFNQNISTGGGITVNFNSGRNDTNQAFALFSPQYTTNAQVQVTQPLFRNFRIDQYRANIKLVNLDMDISDSQFKQKVNDTIAAIQAQYWDLVSAIQAYDISRESVRLAQITVENNKKKVEIGTLAPIGVTEARADMANREVDLITAEDRIYQAQNRLRALISKDRNADIWHQTIVPVETPEFKEIKVSLDEAINTALENRPELEQLGINLEKNDVNYRLNENSGKWQVNLVGYFGSQGVAGPQGYDPITGEPKIPPALVGKIGTAYKTLFTEGFTNWMFGVSLEIPLKNRSLEASLAQTRIQKRQLLMNRQVTEQTIIVQVRNAVQAIDTSRQRVDTARVARELAEEQLEGETKRFQAGLSQNFQVLQRQRDLSSAQGAELNALIAYKKAVIDLQSAMYTLLNANDFEIAKTSSTAAPVK